MFSHFAEEFGLIGSLLLLWLFFSIIKRVTLIGDQSKNNFSKIFCYAFAFNFFLYIAINLGMVTGLIASRRSAIANIVIWWNGYANQHDRSWNCFKF